MYISRIIKTPQKLKTHRILPHSTFPFLPVALSTIQYFISFIFPVFPSFVCFKHLLTNLYLQPYHFTSQKKLRCCWVGRMLWETNFILRIILCILVSWLHYPLGNLAYSVLYITENTGRLFSSCGFEMGAPEYSFIS